MLIRVNRLLKVSDFNNWFKKLTGYHTAKTDFRVFFDCIHPETLRAMAKKFPEHCANSPESQGMAQYMLDLADDKERGGIAV